MGPVLSHGCEGIYDGRHGLASATSSKLTLVANLPAPLQDRFGRKHTYLRVSLTDRCNFRCVYCMPEHGAPWQPRDQILTYEEICALVRFFAARGVSKVRLTGGEPTIRKGYVDLVGHLSKIDGLDELGLTTNGSRLALDAAALRASGLTTVNVSLDSLHPDRFHHITQRHGLDRVLAGIDAALNAGLTTKVNVVVMPGMNDDEVLDFVALAIDRPLTIRFIEFMPFLENQWEASRVISSAELRDKIATAFELQPMPGVPEDVAREFSVPGFVGKVAFVSSVTESFCDGCNRLRLTADGQLKSCLFLPPTVSLRDLMRSGATEGELERAVNECLDGKWKAHPPMRSWTQLDNLTMVQIGG